VLAEKEEKLCDDAENYTAMSRREWKWEGMGMSYREQYGNGNGFMFKLN